MKDGQPVFQDDSVYYVRLHVYWKCAHALLYSAKKGLGQNLTSLTACYGYAKKEALNFCNQSFSVAVLKCSHPQHDINMHYTPMQHYPPHYLPQPSTHTNNKCKGRRLSDTILEVSASKQSSHPQTVSAVWKRDQWPAEKWSGQGWTSQTGDATSVIAETACLASLPSVSHRTVQEHTRIIFWQALANVITESQTHSKNQALVYGLLINNHISLKKGSPHLLHLSTHLQPRTHFSPGCISAQDAFQPRMYVFQPKDNFQDCWPMPNMHADKLLQLWPRLSSFKFEGKSWGDISASIFSWSDAHGKTF